MREIDFSIHRHIIEFSSFNEPIYLIPFGDIHRFSPNCDEEKWLEFCAWAAKKERCFFLGMGDYDDMLSDSERRAVLNANLHESTLYSLEELYKKRTDRLIREIGFMRGKIVGLLEGNHYGLMEDGRSTTQYMCTELGTPYLGVSSFVRLSLKYAKSNVTMSLDIWAHHGKGASRLVGGSLNTVQHMGENAVADIYLMGHDHKKSVATKSRMVLGNGSGNLKLSNKKVLYGRTGSFLKGYEPGRSSYVARAGLPPCDLGVIKIELTPHRKRNKKEHTEDVYCDIHASI